MGVDGPVLYDMCTHFEMQIMNLIDVPPPPITARQTTGQGTVTTVNTPPPPNADPNLGEAQGTVTISPPPNNADNFGTEDFFPLSQIVDGCNPPEECQHQ